MIGTDHLFKRFQIFVSSTYLDLLEEREHLSKSLYKAKYIVEGMENFTASSSQQWDVIKNRINKSDVYVLIISDRYGSFAQNAHELEPGLVKKNEKISYTHLEYRYAKSIGLPILAFLKQNKYGDANIAKFIDEVKKSKVSPDYWSDIRDLLSVVLPALEELLSNKSFESQNGWVKVKSLNQPISQGHDSVHLLSKIHYVKFVSYSNKKKSPCLYKKYIPRLDKEIEVWDEYVTLTINQLSHVIDEFHPYFRTDGDAVDFASLFPFIPKIEFTDTNAAAHDKQFNPRITVTSSNYVFANSYYNGFQDGIMDIAVKATKSAKEVKMIVDFTSIASFDSLFVCTECLQIDKKGKKIDLSNAYTLIQPGVYFIERFNLEEDTVIKFKFN